MEIEQLLKSSRELQLPLNEKVSNAVSKLTELSELVEKHSQDRDNTITKLQRNERDCVLLSEMQMVHDEEKCQLLKEIIDDKKREIKRLLEELKQKDRKLEQSRQKAKSLQEKLSEVQVEVKLRHEDMKMLQKEKEELTRSYNSERETVRKLVQALTSDRDELKVRNIYIPLCRALRVLVHEGNLVNDRGRNNARAESECIIRPRSLTRLPECTKARNARQSGI